MSKQTYLLPIRVVIQSTDDTDDIIKGLNEKLVEFFEVYADALAAVDDSIDIRWSVNKRMEE